MKDQIPKIMAKAPASTLLLRLKDASLWYVNVKRLCNITGWSVSLMYHLVIATTCQIGRIYLRTSMTPPKRLKQVRLIDLPVETS